MIDYLNKLIVLILNHELKEITRYLLLYNILTDSKYMNNIMIY